METEEIINKLAERLESVREAMSYTDCNCNRHENKLVNWKKHDPECVVYMLGAYIQRCLLHTGILFRIAQEKIISIRDDELCHYKDKSSPLHSSKYHSGKICIEEGCNKPAGTYWNINLCSECTILKIDMIIMISNGLLARFDSIRETTEHVEETGN
jgi:hypothetical protein